MKRSMNFYLLMGWRNVWRNQRRSAITIAALALSVGLLVFFIAMMESYLVNMEENVVGMTLGHLQVHHPLYRSDQNLFQVIENATALTAEVTAAGFPASRRIYGYGLLANDRTGKASGVKLQGIDLEAEKGVTTLHLERNLFKGRYLTGATRIHQPQGEEPGDPGSDVFADPLGADPRAEGAGDLAPIELEIGEMVVGKKLAAYLDVSPGEVVSVVTMAADGTLGNELFDVVGVMKNFSEVEDRSLGLVTEGDYQRLFNLPVGVAHEIAVRVPDGNDLGKAMDAVAAMVAERGQGDKAETWRDIAPAQAEMIDFSRAATPIFALTVYIGTALLIMNAMLMMVFERIREYGVMKAIGLKARQIVVLVYVETFFLCLLGALAGLGVGVPLTLWVDTVGIDLTTLVPDGLAISGSVLDPVLRADLTASALWMPVVALFAISFVSVLYPAIKAALLEPVKAIYHV